MPKQEFCVSQPEHEKQRVDVFLADRLPDLSRSQIQKFIMQDRVKVNGALTKPSYRLQDGDTITIEYEISVQEGILPENIPLDIIYKDDHIVLINKPSGMVVHPGSGVSSNTLVHALLYHFPKMGEVGEKERPGLVHRLDKDTSGVLVAALTEDTFHDLGKQFKERNVEKSYYGLVWGRPREKEGIIARPIGRHVKHGSRISVKTNKPRDAKTLYSVEKNFSENTLLVLKPVTGRTHQIRVHLTSIGHPIVGDPLYGKRKTQCPRLFLHAFSLKFTHPDSGERVQFKAPLPSDLQAFLDGLDE